MYARFWTRRHFRISSNDIHARHSSLPASTSSLQQPSNSYKLLLLSNGKTCYFGPISNVDGYFDQIGHPIPSNTNPAEFLLDIVSSDFGGSKEFAQNRVRKIQKAWTESNEATAMDRQVFELVRSMEEKKDPVFCGRFQAA